MLLNLLTFAVLVLAIAVCLAAARHFWHSSKRWLKWLGTAVFLAGALGFLAVTLMGAFGFVRLDAKQSNPVPAVTAAATPEQVLRGQKLANLCVTCHSTAGKLPLDGSNRNVIAFPPIGTLVGPNLTPGGQQVASMSDGQLVRAIREGVGADGKPLLGMPSWSFKHLSDADVQALVAYLHSQPAAAHDTPKRDLNLLAGLSVGAGLAPLSSQTAITQPVSSPPAAASVDYGKYLVAVGGCRDCHGKKLAGKSDLVTATPNGPNLPLAAELMSPEQFISTIRTGVTRNGRPIDNAVMPWQDFSAAFSDQELTAIYNYLANLPPTGEANP